MAKPSKKQALEELAGIAERYVGMWLDDEQCLLLEYGQEDEFPKREAESDRVLKRIAYLKQVVLDG